MGAVPFNEFLQPDNFTIGTSTVSVPRAVLCPPNTNTNSWIRAIDTVSLTFSSFFTMSLSDDDDFESLLNYAILLATK